MRRYFKDPTDYRGKQINPSYDEQLKETFELKCKKCGSINVVFNYEPEYAYSEITIDPARLSFGCNDCQENDIHA